MKKYLKRWNTLTEKEKLLFFTSYMMRSNMCSVCIQPLSIVPGDVYEKAARQCDQCDTMFPGRLHGCPCDDYAEGILKDRPPTVIEYCLIKDGWIDK